jgi:CRISPR/Cas system-associated exonuclease Cas4 (RecB family)
MDGKIPENDRNFNCGNDLDCILEKENSKPWVRKTGHYHPSSIKGCKRAMYYDRIGTKPVQRIDAPLRMLFDMGHALHDMIQKYYQQMPGFESEVKIEFSPLHIYGHCDGVFKKQDWVLEIKTVGESVYRTLVRPSIAHIWQIHCYMFALDIPRTQLLYVNRASGSKRLFKVEFSNDIWDDVIGILSYVEDHVKRQEPPPKEISGYVCGTCKFYNECKPEFGGR